jgi:hypothetical protein
MSKIEFFCRHCDCGLEAPLDMNGQEIECPSCEKTIEVPTIVTSKNKPGHSIFYYVFWATLSFLGVLAILFFAITILFWIFFIGASVDVRRESGEDELRVLPVLTEVERERARLLLEEITIERDEFDNSTNYFPRANDGWKTAIFLYVVKQGDDLTLRWCIRYFGDEWLFIQQYRFKIDEGEVISLIPRCGVGRNNFRCDVWECFNEDATEYAEILNKIFDGRRVVLRMEGRKRTKDLELSADDIQQMKDVLLIFRSLGGQWPIGE